MVKANTNKDVTLDESLKASTREFFGRQYIQLLFSDHDKNDLACKYVMHDNKLILIVQEIVEIQNRYRASKDNRLESNYAYKTLYVDFDYLLELVKMNSLKLFINESNNKSQDTDIVNLSITWADENKYTKVNFPKRTRIY